MEFHYWDHLLSLYSNPEGPGDDDTLNYLHQNRFNTQLAQEFIDIIVSKEININMKQFALTILRTCELSLNSDQFSKLFLALSSDNIEFTAVLGQYLAISIESEKFFFEINEPSMEMMFGIVDMVYFYTKKNNNIISLELLQFLINTLFDESQNIWTRALAARTISSVCYKLDNISIIEENILIFYEIPVQYETLPMYIELFPCFEILYPTERKLNIIVEKLYEIAQNIPLPRPYDAPDQTSVSFSDFAISLINDFIQVFDEEVMQCDIKKLVISLINLCVISEEEMEMWNQDIEAFVCDNMFDNEDKKLLRYESAKCLGGLIVISEILDYCKELIPQDPKYIEATYYIISFHATLSSSIEFDFILPNESTDELTFGRFLQATSLLNMDISNDYFTYALESDSFILKICAAYGLNAKKTFITDMILKAVMSIAPLFSQFQTGVVIEFLRLFADLISKIIDQSIDYLPFILNEMITQWNKYLLQAEVANELCSIFSTFTKIPTIYDFVQDSMLPLIIDGLNSGAFYPSICLIEVLVSHLPQENYIINGEIIKIICQLLNESLIYDISEDNVFNVMLSLASFYSRVEFNQIVFSWFIHIIGSGEFKCFIASLGVSLYISSDIDHKSILIDKIFDNFQQKYNSLQESPYINESLKINILESLACILCYFNFYDSPLFSQIILEKQIQIKLLATWISDNIRYIISPFNSKLLFSFLFSYADNSNPFLEIGLNSFYQCVLCRSCIVYDTNQTFLFFPMDPNYVLHPFRSIDFLQFFNIFITDYSILDKDYQNKIYCFISNCHSTSI